MCLLNYLPNNKRKESAPEILGRTLLSHFGFYFLVTGELLAKLSKRLIGCEGARLGTLVI